MSPTINYPHSHTHEAFNRAHLCVSFKLQIHISSFFILKAILCRHDENSSGGRLCVCRLGSNMLFYYRRHYGA